MIQNLQEFLSVFDCIAGANQATYISIPITTGFQFLDWYKTEGRQIKPGELYDELHYKKVIEVNIRASAAFIAHIRQQKKGLVIEPTKLTVLGWGQNDYHNFWVAVINRFIKDAWFADGWHLSKGCTLEFLTAKQKGIPVYDMQGREISTEQGYTLIESTIREYSALHLETDFFSDILSKLGNNIPVHNS